MCDRAYTYDLLGRLLTAGFVTCGETVTNAFDALGRLTSTSSNAGGTAHALSYLYDLADRRTRVTWWDGFTVDYDRLVTGEVSKVRENGAVSGVGLLAAYAYDSLGNRTSLTFGNGVVQAFTYDPVSRLASLSNDLPGGSTNDLTIGTPAAPITYNPASQITSVVRTGDAYAFTPISSGTTTTTSNGLNQQITIGGSTATWDNLGNLTSDPTSGNTYGYDLENKLASSVAGGTTRTLNYDPLNRLDRYNPGTATRFIYDGLDAAAEIDTSGAIQHRYVMGDGPDELLVDYVGSGTTTRRFLSRDERGSVISLTDSSGGLIAINTYDEYGKPGAANTGRFQYTGQRWLSEIGAYDYKARDYLPHLGIFAQTDPIGQTGGANLYAYVGNDPVNFVDPLGLQGAEPPEIVITGRRVSCPNGGIRTADGSCTTRNLGAGGSFGGIGGALGGGERGGGGRDADQQQQVCRTQPFSTLLSNPSVQSQIAQATQQAENTPNLGLGPDVPENGSEVAFNVLDFGLFTYVGGTYTGSGDPSVPREGRVDYQPSPISPSRFSITMFHVHQSPLAAPGLSPADIALTGTADDNPGINVVAVQPSRGTFCAAAH